MDIRDMVVIVTGGSGVVGRAVCARLIGDGATVVLADLTPPEQEAVAEMGDDASKLHHLRADVTDETSVRELVAVAGRDYGGPHALLNIAGGFRYGPTVEEMSEADWDGMIQLNLKSAFLCIKNVLPVMKAQGYGRIVSVAARSGLKGDAMVAPYAVSKGGVILLTQSVADEVRDYDITVNAVLPSIVDTPFNREGMPGADFATWVAPQDLAAVMAFLISEDARAISGASIPVYHKA